MATRNAFSADEWTLLRIAPTFVAVGVSAADPSGLVGSVKEALAGANAAIAKVNENRALELFAALASDGSLPRIPDVASLLGDGTHEQKLASFKMVALERVRSAADLVARMASPAEADAYRNMLVSVAERAANAAKEGGFLGIGGVRVSEKERAFIAEVAKAAGV